MNFKRSGHSDDVWFVIALVLTAAFAAERYFETDREITRIEQAQAERALAAQTAAAPAVASVASADAVQGP
jgi:hypothetical protein